MVTYIPFLMMIRYFGSQFPLLVYAENYEAACAKANEKFPDCEISNNTIL